MSWLPAPRWPSPPVQSNEAASLPGDVIGVAAMAHSSGSITMHVRAPVLVAVAARLALLFIVGHGVVGLGVGAQPLVGPLGADGPAETAANVLVGAPPPGAPAPATAAGAGPWMRPLLFLRDTAGAVADNVQQIMSVGRDVEALRDDLKLQEALWRKAEQDLSNENAQLAAKVAALHAEIKAGDAVRNEVREMRLRLEEQKRQNEALRRGFEQEDGERNLQRQFLVERVKGLSRILNDTHASAEKEMKDAHDRQLQLETDSVSLHLTIKVFQDQLEKGRQESTAVQKKANETATELERQLDEMVGGQRRLERQLAQAIDFGDDLKAVQAELKKEVDAIIKIKQDQATSTAACEKEISKQQKVLHFLEGKVGERKQDAVQLCEPVKGEQAILKVLVEQCEAKLEQAPLER